jgi:autotransporter-associated beta strand protein
MSQIYSGDILTIKGSGVFTDRNVGTNKSMTIDVALSGTDAGNYALSSTRVESASSGVYGSITQLASVTWVGPATGGRWSNASYWAGGAIPDGNNVATVYIPVGKNVVYDSALVGQTSSTIINSGVMTFNSAANFTLNNVIQGSGSIVQSGLGTLTIAGNNSYTGNTSIGSSRLVLAHANALGTGQVISSGGTLSVTSGVTLPKLVVNGDVTLASDISTTGNQTYTGTLTIAANDASLTSVVNGNTSIDTRTLTAGGAMIFNAINTGGVYGDTRSLTVNATGAVTFNGEVGSSSESAKGSNIYRLDVTGSTITVNADVTTREAQIYRSPVLIGDNGTNGLTRTLMSIDPAITFASTVDDVTPNTHTLVTKAIALNGLGNPAVTFSNDVGKNQPLASLEVITGSGSTVPYGFVDPNSNAYIGNITIAGNVTTQGNQTYTSQTVTLGDPSLTGQKQIFTSTSGGDVTFNLGTVSGGFVAASPSLAVSFDVGSGVVTGTTQLATAGIRYDMIVQSNGPLNLLSEIRKQFNQQSDVNAEVEASVDVGDLETVADDCAPGDEECLKKARKRK